MNRYRLGFLIAFASFIVSIAASQVPETLYQGLKWRSIGPYRGGRSVAVAGSLARPKEYFFGATGGGVWKTTDEGVNWSCVSDGFFRTASVGAVAVAASNPDIVFAGTGEKDIRGNISEGDGIYRSSDGGKTWQHSGLTETQTISEIVIDPSNPQTIFVAALGHIYGPNAERGVFKSTDGGQTWKNVLFKNDRSGAIDLSVDPSNPKVIYAALWEAFRTPYSLNSGGPGSGLHKSTDGGETWTEITRSPGLPEGVIGKIGVSVSPAKPSRVFAIFEAKDGGIFRSDDSGATWQKVNSDSNWRQRPWYYTHVFADPKNPETVYVQNVGMGRSTDGGKTFQGVSTPHSDNHDLWIAPDDPNRMACANDGGASVSMDGGKTWTEQDVPTAQFYHVTTDNAFPYRILGAQQDNSTVRITSRTFGAGIGRADWTGTAGGESGYIAANPLDPDIVFGGSYGGDLVMLNHRTGERRSVDVWPDNPMGHGTIDSKDRFQWTFPIVYSPRNPKVLYTSSQRLFKSTNDGETWTAISPDLTRNDPATHGSSGGPITQDNTSVEYYGTIFTVAESPLKSGLIWTGSDDGLVHITRNSGASWQTVTPSAMPKWGLCSMVEASPHAEGTAYLAVDNHENDDRKPYVYRTTDYGKRWTAITSGIPEGAFVRVVREDPIRAGLLYAGTERGVFVSFDSGSQWQPLQMNLPVCPVHDLALKDDDLVAATHGRSFWVLDDISPLRQMASLSPEKPFLFQPKDAIRWRRGGFGGGGRGRGAAPENLGQNPLNGVVLSYFLPKDAQSVTFEVFDRQGELVFADKSAPAKAGFQRIAARFTYPSFKSVPGMILWAGGSSPIQAPPGVYTVKWTADGFSDRKPVRYTLDPRGSATEADLVAQADFASAISARIDEANNAVLKIRDSKKKIDEVIAKKPALKQEGDLLKEKLTNIEGEIHQYRSKSGQDPLNFPIKLNDKLAGVLSVVLGSDFRPTDQSYQVFEELSRQLQVQFDRLSAFEMGEVAAFLRRGQAEP